VFSITIPPIAEVDALALLPLADVKAHLRVDGPEDDAAIKVILRDAIDTASEQAGRVFGVRPGCVFACPRFPELASLPISLGYRPVTSLSEITYLTDSGQASVPLANVTLVGMTGEVFADLPGGWPTDARDTGSVRVTFTAGQSALTNIARRAILLIVADWFENRGDTERKQAIPIGAQRLLFQMHPGGIAS
jgi:uncharacterized phiE125 gp8 family phage protein